MPKAKITYLQITNKPVVDMSLKNFSALREAKKIAHARDLEENGKYCPRCHETLPLSEFYGPWSASGLTSFSSYCRSCMVDYSRQRHKRAHEHNRSG